MSTRITDLPQATELNGSEIMPLVQNGVTKKATLDFINLAAPAGLILAQTQQVYEDTVDVKEATDAVLVETQSTLADTQVVLGQTIAVRNETEAVKIDFETQYLGPHASPPTLDNVGDPLENGALYWNTTSMAMFVWDGASWTAFSSAVASVNGIIGEVVLGFADVGAAGPGANANITSLSGLTGDVGTATGLQFDTATPSAGAVGKLTWNTTDQTLDLGVSAAGVALQIGQEVYYRVKNGTAGVIPNGSMVRYTGTNGASGNILVAPALADGTYASQTFLGLTTEVLNPGDSGFATHFGRVRGIDTTGNPYGEVWADGDIIFASALVAGWLTKVPPPAPNNRVRVGIVVHAHPNGTMFIRPTYGGKLSENEQVQISAIADGDVLKYVAANSRFENMSFATAGIEPLGAAASSMSAHLVDPDPHPQYTTTAEASAAAPVQSVAGKTGTVALGPADVGAAAASHGHAIVDVSGLAGELSNAVKLSGDQVIDGIKSFSRIDQGTYVRQAISLPAPGESTLGGRWFVRLCPTTGPVFISGRVRIGGVWSHAPVMGVLELECGVYFAAGATSISNGSCRVSAATGPAYDNLRIGDLTVVSGWVGLYVYASSTNTVDVLIDGLVHGDFSPSSSPWESSGLPAPRPVEFAGGVSLLSGQLNGNAATATKLATTRSISLAGDVTGSASFDGSGDVTIAATVADSSHNHVISNVGGLQAALDLKLSKDNLVGTVSQSGGIPTGAVVERATNVNGTYTRFADGTQICIADLSTPGDSFTWTFPATFSGPPCIQVNENHSPQYNYYYTNTYNDNSNSCLVFRYRRADDTPTTDAYYTRLLAVGSWF